jgi:hypothetical protein
VNDDELERILVRSGCDLILRYYPSTCLKGLWKTTKNLNQDSRLPEPRFELRTSQNRSRSVNHSTTMCDRGKMRNVFKLWMNSLKGRDLMEDAGIVGRITLK